MPSITDPAREFAEVCEKISPASRNRGDDYLAEKFSVAAWSTQFYQIIFCLIERADALIGIVNTLDMDDDIKADAKKHIKEIKGAFAREAMSKPWETSGANYVKRENIQAIKMLSPHVRQKFSYPKLRSEEITELLNIIEELENYLSEHQLYEHDFIRQALLEGIRSVKFRLERIGWLGWGYTIESLREVIAAYMALERSIPNSAPPADVEALLKRMKPLLKAFAEKVGVAKEVYETGGFLLQLYGATVLVSQGVTGLLAGPVKLLAGP